MLKWCIVDNEGVVFPCSSKESAESIVQFESEKYDVKGLSVELREIEDTEESEQ